VPLGALNEVTLLVEEAEAVRLRDLEKLAQKDCAAAMCISRTTFARILDAARRKIADALLGGKAIRIEGGSFEMAVRRYRCPAGHEWDVPFETLVRTPPEVCPSCDSPSIISVPAAQAAPPGAGGIRYARGRPAERGLEP